MFRRPRQDLGVLVRGVIVDDQMQVKFRGRLGVDLPQEFEPPLMPVPGLALGDYQAVDDADGRE